MRKFLHIVLHEVYLGDVILLDTIESIAEFVSNLVHACVDHLDMAAILISSLAGGQLSMIDLRLERWLHERL